MMVLYSGTTCPFSQRCRLVLFEKGMDFEIRDVDLFNKPEDIAVMNPYGQVPILVERDLILYESNIINEYIDERFPHPQLMPADPVQRARARLFLLNFEKELFVHVGTLENEKGKAAEKNHEKARLAIRDRLTQLAPIFLKNKYMLGEEFSMLDVAIAPLLWRLDHYGIELSKNAAPLMNFEATSQLQMGNEWIEFSARFSGKSHKIEVPITNILAIYARENGQGMAFPVESAGGEAQDSGADAELADEPESPAAPIGAGPRAAETSSSAADTTSARTDGATGDPQPDDDGTKGGGRARLKIVK
ncbi:hypothetical protein KCU90_g3439, partial [Aureobasidium melanogenum]